MLINNNSISNKVGQIIREVRNVFSNAANLDNDNRSLISVLSDKLTNWAKEAEQDRLKYEQQQQALQFQQQFYETSSDLKQMLAHALNSMPSHYDFWGNISPHSIHLTFNENVWSFRLIHSQDAHTVPQHFTPTASELQQILMNIYISALITLKEKIITNTDLLQSQSYTSALCDASKCKSILEFWNDYYVTYTANKRYLFQVSGLTMTPVSDGVLVSFTAIYNDCGLHPSHYWNYLQSYCS